MTGRDCLAHDAGLQSCMLPATASVDLTWF